MERRWLGVILVVGLAMVRMTMQCDRHRRQQDAIDQINSLPAFDYKYTLETERARRELEALRQGAEADAPQAAESITFEVVVSGHHYDWPEGGNRTNELVEVAAPDNSGDVALHIARTPTWTYRDRNLAFDYPSDIVLTGSGTEFSLKTATGPVLVLTVLDGSRKSVLDLYRSNLESRSFECTAGKISVGSAEVAGFRCSGFAARVWTHFAATTVGSKVVAWSITQQREVDERSDDYQALLAIVASLRAKAPSLQPQFEVRIGDSDVPIKASVGKPFIVKSTRTKFSARIEARPTIRSTIAGRTFERAAQLTLVQAKAVPVMILLQDGTTGLQYTEVPSGVLAESAFFQRLAQTDKEATAVARQFSSSERNGSSFEGGGPLTDFTLEFFPIKRSDGTQSLITLQYATEARKDYEANFPKYAATIDSLLGEFTP